MSPPEGRNVKQKAGHFGLAAGRVERCAGTRHQWGYKESLAMLSRSCLVGLALLVLEGALRGAAYAEECPAKSTSMDDVIAVLNAAPGCGPAMKLFEACAYGASGDAQFGEVVEKKCEADFVGQQKPPQKLSYQRELQACDRKYRNKSGTMYISATAFCRAEVAQRYSQQALKAAGQKAR
ncbi:hypothetical protein [Bradyrhizobium diversitatis]|nr:hypothetical protein [Bradyrhizobium diversitatis]